MTQRRRRDSQHTRGRAKASMLGDGDIYFLDDKLDFNIRISPKGAGMLLAPVYKLFEYKGEGSMKNPNWHPKVF